MPASSQLRSQKRRSLRGNVDRNSSYGIRWIAEDEVVPYVGTWIEIQCLKSVEEIVKVVPYVGTWIEIDIPFLIFFWNDVVPYVGTWIEITQAISSLLPIRSFPTWERG